MYALCCLKKYCRVFQACFGLETRVLPWRRQECITGAGTGSETAIAAVVTDETHHKYAVNDLCLIPRWAILDPTLTVSLPAGVTAETGLDALTHAVEAYIGRFYNTRETRSITR